MSHTQPGWLFYFLAGLYLLQFITFFYHLIVGYRLPTIAWKKSRTQIEDANEEY